MHTEDRVAVYLNQRHARALTPRQRRRVLHKARGKERAAALALLVALAAAGCSPGGVGPRRVKAIAYGAHHGFRELDPTTTEPPRPTVTEVSRSHPSPRRPLSSPRPARGGSIEACIRARENHGSYARGDNPTHTGMFQFAYGTWVAHGGNPATWNDPSPAEQEQVFRNTVAANGYRDWQPWDGC